MASKSESEIQGVVVDLDLDKEDAALREDIGRPTIIKLRGRVISVQHPRLWSSKAMSAVNSGEWMTWAEEVIEDVTQFKHFEKCNPRNYQMKAIMDRLQKDAGEELGKLREPDDSSPGTLTT